jgi:hypothetical protein
VTLGLYATTLLVASLLPAASFASLTVPPPYSARYRDRAGDSNTSPDITAVTVGNDASGRLTFRLTIPNRPAREAGDAIVLTIDSDHNLSSGAPDVGVDAILRLDALPSGGVQVTDARWFRHQFIALPNGAVTGTYSNGAATLSMPTWVLGAAPKFEFDALTLDMAASETATFTGDVAGPYTYLLGGPNAAPQPLLDNLTRSTPRAGNRLIVLARTTSGGKPIDPTEARVVCHAQIGGRAVPARPGWRELGRNTIAYKTLTTCSIDLPRHNTAGKRLTGSIRVTYLSKTTTRTFSYRIKK